MDFLFQLKYFGTDVLFHSKGCAMLEWQAVAEWHWSGGEEIPHVQGHRNPSKTVGTGGL